MSEYIVIKVKIEELNKELEELIRKVLIEIES